MIDLLIPQLDKGSEVISDLRIFPLKNTDATEVARNIKEIFRLSTTVPRQPKQEKGKQTPQQQRAEAVRQMIEIQRKDGVTQVDAATMVTVSANRQSNSVVVAAPPEAMAIIEMIIQELDQSAAASTVAAVRLYPLRHAEVRATVTAVQQIFAQVGGRGRGTAAAGGRGAPVRVTGDEAGRLVIVSAPAEKHELIAQVIRDIDRAQETDQVTVRVYRIRHADSTSVASALNGTLGVRTGATAGRGRRGGAQSGGGGLRISADRSSNSVVVRAGKEDHERIAKLIEEIDIAPTAAQRVQLIPLNSADAANVAQILNRVFGGGAGRGRAGGGAVQRVVIEPDRDSRMLMVRADEETVAKIRILAGQLDAAPIGKTTRTLLTLKHAQAASVAAALTQAFAPARGQRITPDDLVIVVAEPVSNSVIVSATPENLDKVKSLLAKLDTEETGGMRTEFVLLRNAKATELATVLSRVAGGAGSAVRGGRGRGGVQQGVVVSADAGSNALVMSGPSAELDKVMKMALQLDQASSTAVSGVYIIALENGSASEVAAIVRDFYNQQLQAARRDKRSVDPLAVSADARANAVILATTPKMYTQVSQWITQVEGMKQRIGTPRIITLEHADPAEVEKAIQQLFGGSSSTSGNPGRGGRSRGNPGPSGTGTGRVETSVMSKQRAILINASDDDYEAIVKLAESLELAAAGTRKQVQVFRLENAMNTRVATALNAMYSSAARTGAEEDRVSIVALPQTTAVVVTATKEKMEEIAGLITQLDTVEVAPQLEFRIFPLEHAMPTKVLPALRQMLQQIQRTRPDEPINVQADERTRSIIITARGTVFDQVEKIIQTLDKAPAEPVAEVLIIPLKRADAASLADVLNEMLRPSATNQVTPEARALQEQVRRLRVRSTVTEQIPELDLTKPIKIQADPARPQGSNSLIIQSTPDNLKAMQAIVSVMDTVPITEGVKVRLLHLQNADALSVMQILRSIFDQGQQLAGRTGTTVAGRADPESTTGKALVHRFNVSADLRTNTLVVSGLEESIALAELIVKDLDRESGKIVTEVRVFRLKHASADRMLPVLRAVFAEGTPVPDAEGLQTHVTRLRTVLNDDPKRTSGLAKVRVALTIQADPSTNMLVVAARSDVMPLIADVVKTMDIPGAGSLNNVRIFPLKNADATRIRQVLTDLHSGPNAALIRDEDKPTLSVDTRTNSLIVCTSDKTVVMIEMLLRNLDAAQSIDLLDIRLIPLKSADAAPLATTLQRMVDARVQRQAALGLRDAESLRVLILPDERSNSLIVGGSAESFQLVKLLAEQLDGASPALGGQIQLIPLKEANSGALAQTLVNLFNQRYQAARTPEVQRQRPVIVPDLRTNSLLVAANQDDTAVLKSLLGKLDVKLVDPAVRLVVIPLEHNDAGVVGPMIQSIFQARLTSMTVAGQTPVPQDRVDVVSDALSNALVISASKENLALVEGLLAKVDVEPPTETGIVRMYPLVNSDAQRIQSVLDGLFSKGLYKPGLAAAGASAALQAREKVSIAVDVRTNVLIVSASKENFAVIDEIIKRIDATDDFGALGDVRMYLLKSADATRLGPMLQQFFNAKRTAEQQTGASGRSLPVSIIADARTNTLLVAGSRESFQAVEAMLKQLDGDQATPAGEFRVFYLKQATAAALQPTLQSLFDRRVTRGQTRDQVTVLADPKTNALIVGATPEDMKLAESLIARLDAEPETPGTTVQVFPLVRADATQVANTIRDLYQSQGIPAAAVPGISVDERINALVVTGGEADMKRIAELVGQLDTDTVARVTEIRVFTLVNADATELGRILTDALTNKPTPMTAVSPNRQHILQFVTKTDDGRRLIASALQEGVLITADTRTNSLVVSAPAQFMPLLEALIDAMDSTTPRIGEIRVFTLVNADCQRMGAVLTELFRLQQTAAADMRSVNYTLTTTAPSGEGASATLGTVEQYALSITVDVRTNSLLVGGTKQYVDLCSKIIEELDSCPAQERMTKVYRLRNARAGDIESALTSFLDRERAQLTSTLGPDGMGATQRLLEREVAVVSVASDGDAANANTLLISASPRYFETLCEIISELDQPPPQVLIQVLLAEVRLDDTTDFGVDWNFAATSGSKSIDTGTNFGIQTDIGKSGFNLAISGSDLGFFLRALQAQGRLEVLSRPQILASDNQEAEINVGQQVPFIRDSRITEAGTTINTLDYEDVGIILRVTPRINPDGSVRMEVSPEISSISDSTVQVSETVNAIIINNRSAETTVTVQDGHTIVIGGLITTEDQEREDKVPLLGDLPGLGWLFRKTKLVKVRTELLIILTPHVLRNVEEADAESQKQFRGLNLLGEMEAEDVLKQRALRPIRGLRGEAEAPEVVPEPAPGSPISLELVPRLERKRAFRERVERE